MCGCKGGRKQVASPAEVEAIMEQAEPVTMDQVETWASAADRRRRSAANAMSNASANAA